MDAESSHDDDLIVVGATVSDGDGLPLDGLQ